MASHGLYEVFSGYTSHVGGWRLVIPLIVYGVGMGMIFIPLFDIIMGDISDREVGSASSLLESIQQMGSMVRRWTRNRHSRDLTPGLQSGPGLSARHSARREASAICVARGLIRYPKGAGAVAQPVRAADS